MDSYNSIIKQIIQLLEMGKIVEDILYMYIIEDTQWDKY